MKVQNLRSEAEIIAKYLVGELPREYIAQRYQSALNNYRKEISANDQKLLTFIHAHPSSIGLIDAGLNLLHNDSEVRRRIHLMFSILESTPEYHSHFLSQNVNPFYAVVILFTGAVGLLKTILGAAIVRVIAK